MSTQDVENMRLAMLANGYTPLPNEGKICRLKGWPTVGVSSRTINSWTCIKSLPDTGVRIENKVGVLDLDIDNPLIVKVAEAVETRYPTIKRSLLRHGRGHKEAWFFRISQPFSRYATRRWAAPGPSNCERDEASVEAFGGEVSRQFGCLGAHTRGLDREVVIAYEWADGRSPATVPLDRLPEFSPADVADMIAISEHVLADEGWKPLSSSLSIESKPDRVFDLTDRMRFDCNDGVTRSLVELEAMRGGEKLRCSASWLEPDALDVTRCLIGWSFVLRCITVWEAKTCQTHLPADRAPTQYKSRQAELDVELRRRRMAREQSHNPKKGT